MPTSDASLIMNHKMPLCITIHPPGIFPTSDWEMVYWLKLKDISNQEIEQKCSELRSKIQKLISESFSNELTTV